MIGIDIIDLKDPVLHNREKSIRFISHPDDEYPENENTFWLLWTAKEAIFKAERKIQDFNPKNIRVKIYSSGESLLISSGNVSGKIIVDSRKVLAIVQLTNTNITSYQFDELLHPSVNPSQEVRKKIVDYFIRTKSLQTNIEKDTSGLPILNYRKLPISISHHGKFIAFAYPEF